MDDLLISEQMAALLDSYTKDLSTAEKAPRVHSHSQHVVLFSRSLLEDGTFQN